MSSTHVATPNSKTSARPNHPNQDSRGTEQQAASEVAGGGNIEHGSKGRIDRDEFESGGRHAGGDRRGQPSEQDLRPPENHEAARQGNPTSSSYNAENRKGAEAMRKEAANSPGSEYAREANEGKITERPQRGAAGSGKSSSKES